MSSESAAEASAAAAEAEAAFLRSPEGATMSMLTAFIVFIGFLLFVTLVILLSLRMIFRPKRCSVSSSQ
jgi:hypothetical protein